MLRTNSKKARENVRNYIMTDSEYIAERLAEMLPNDGITAENLKESDALYCVWQCFVGEASPRWDKNVFEQFERWASGLALGGLFLYYYNVSAVQVLGDILEETEEERSKYTEEQAERLLTLLIFREVSKC